MIFFLISLFFKINYTFKFFFHDQPHQNKLYRKRIAEFKKFYIIDVIELNDMPRDTFEFN